MTQSITLGKKALFVGALGVLSTGMLFSTGQPTGGIIPQSHRQQLQVGIDAINNIRAARDSLKKRLDELKAQPDPCAKEKAEIEAIEKLLQPKFPQGFGGVCQQTLEAVNLLRQMETEKLERRGDWIVKNINAERIIYISILSFIAVNFTIWAAFSYHDHLTRKEKELEREAQDYADIREARGGRRE